MMFAFTPFENPIEISDKTIPVLILENKTLFREVITSFEENKTEAYFVFSDNFKPFDFSKHGLFISNVMNIDLNNKKLITKVNSFLEENANIEFIQNIETIKRELLCLGDKLCEVASFDCDYNFDINTADIIKLLQFKIGNSESTAKEKLISYMVLTSKYLKVKFFVVPHLHILFDEDELSLIYETLELNHISVISVECIEPSKKHHKEEYFIVDHDLCIIDNKSF